MRTLHVLHILIMKENCVAFKKVFHNHQTLLTFVFAFIITFIFLFIIDNENYFADASDYMTLSQSFELNGAFSLFNYDPASIRGCLFPLLLHVFTEIVQFFNFSVYTGYNIFCASFVALIITILPYIFKPFIKKEINVIWRLLPLAFLLFFWETLLTSPLSDLPAFTALVAAICFFLYFINNTKKGTKNKTILFLLAIFCGALLYFSYNTRTTYLFPAIIGIVLLAFFNRKKGFFENLVLICGIAIGVIALGSVQGAIYAHHYNEFSIFIDTSRSGYENGLISFQLFEGIKAQQYETALFALNENGELIKDVPGMGIFFTDSVGQKIIHQENIVARTTTSQYFELVSKYPLDFFGIYFRHFINMLNPVFGGAYIKYDSFGAIQTVKSIINYIIMFILSINAYLAIKKRKTLVSALKENNNSELQLELRKKNIHLVFIVLSTLYCLIILPGAIELRFFFPFYIILYGFFAYVVDFKAVFSAIKHYPISMLFLFIFIYGVLCAIWGATYSSFLNTFIGL